MRWRMLPRRFRTWVSLIATAFAFIGWVANGRYTYRHIADVDTNLLQQVIWVHGGGLEIGLWSYRLYEATPFFFREPDPWIQQPWDWRWRWAKIQSFSYKAVFIPFWPLVVLLVLIPSWLYWRDPKWWRAWRCRNCGYNLRAAVSADCPECGKCISRSVA